MKVVRFVLTASDVVHNCQKFEKHCIRGLRLNVTSCKSVEREREMLSSQYCVDA
jgi:hypothetical protein